MRTESGKEILREQARKKARAKKGERVPWHPRIKKLHAKLEKKTPKDRKKKKSRSIFTNPQTGLPGLGTPPVDPTTLDPHLDWPKWTPPAWFDHKMIPKSAIWRPPAKAEVPSLPATTTSDKVNSINYSNHKHTLTLKKRIDTRGRLERQKRQENAD